MAPCLYARWWQVFALLVFAGLGLLARSSHAQEKGANYRISPNDEVEIRVYSEPDLDTRARVDADGKITMPHINEVLLAGKTVPEAIATIKAAYRNGYLRDPQLSVRISAYAPKSFTVLGQVQKPGSIPYPENKSLSLLEAIGLAGGYTRISNQKMTLIRHDASGRVIQKEFEGKKIAAGKQSTEIVLPGDHITVHEGLL